MCREEMDWAYLIQIESQEQFTIYADVTVDVSVVFLETCRLDETRPSTLDPRPSTSHRPRWPQTI